MLGATMCLTGCFSLDSARLPSGDEHVVMRNYGWKLFNWIPLACGNASEDPSCAFVLFRDDITQEKVQSRFAKYANGRQIESLACHTDDSVFFDFFGFNIPYVLCYREVSFSGTLK